MTSISAQPDLPELVQGSPEWHAWRNKGIGASYVPVIMGENDTDDTPYKLWRRLTGRDPELESNWAMTRGTEQEPRARALYELQVGIDTPPACVVHPDLPWALASLDGYNVAESLISEFKFTGKEKHEQARKQEVPRCYKGQAQWQLFVTGAKRHHYVSLEPETADSIEIVPSTADLEYWSRMIPAVQAFWDLVQSDTPPPLTDRDVKDLDGETHQEVFNRWKSSKLVAMQLEEALEEIKGKFKAEQERLEKARLEIGEIVKAQHPKVRCAGVRAITVQRKSGPTLDIRIED
jgi:putative phage-type endonuclease